MSAPKRPQRAGATTRAGQKPIRRLTEKAKYAPSMYMLAWAKLSTPIIEKMRVSPLASMKRSMP
jgi:hypothetical protein